MRHDFDDDTACFRGDVQAATGGILSETNVKRGLRVVHRRQGALREVGAATTRARAAAGSCSSDAASRRDAFDGVDRDHYER